VDVTALCYLPARELARRIAGGELPARDVMAAYLSRIARLNPRLNAIVGKFDDAACLALADEADRKQARGERLGPLHGLPMAFKDLEAAAGLRFTRGSPIFADEVATEDSLIVERLRAAGAIPIGKTNVPEFGMGSHTYNPVYGATRNPWDLTKSAGGSSGGAAAAVAAGLLPLADGGDLGGSLRNPANFNNIVALRPTVGLVPTAPTLMPLMGFSVKGPLARSVGDAAWLLSIMAGPDPRDPGCYPSQPSVFAGPLDRDLTGTRVAWCPDLGGLPLDPRVRAVLDARRQTLVDLGCDVDDVAPDLSDADEVFLTIRRWMTFHTLGPLLAQHRDQLKPEAIAEIELGSRVTGAQLGAAVIRHTQLLDRVRRFQETYEFLLCAVNQLPPFDATLTWPSTVDGVAMEHYVAWMKSTYWISATCRPAASVPAGFTTDGLPVGVQIVGRHRDDLGVLQFAAAFEQATGVGRRRPPEA